MAETMLKFVKVGQRMPEKRAADLRRTDFGEIYGEYPEADAAEQAARCSQCGIPYCQIHCPLHNNIPDWLMLTANGRLEEAYEVSSATNNMPEIFGILTNQLKGYTDQLAAVWAKDLADVNAQLTRLGLPQIDPKCAKAEGCGAVM